MENRKVTTVNENNPLVEEITDLDKSLLQIGFLGLEEEIILIRERDTPEIKGPALSLDWKLPDEVGMSWKATLDLRKSIKKEQYRVEMSKGNTTDFIPLKTDIEENPETVKKFVT